MLFLRTGILTAVSKGPGYNAFVMTGQSLFSMLAVRTRG